MCCSAGSIAVQVCKPLHGIIFIIMMWKMSFNPQILQACFQSVNIILMSAFFASFIFFRLFSLLLLIFFKGISGPLPESNIAFDLVRLIMMILLEGLKVLLIFLLSFCTVLLELGNVFVCLGYTISQFFLLFCLVNFLEGICAPQLALHILKLFAPLCHLLVECSHLIA